MSGSVHGTILLVEDDPQDVDIMRLAFDRVSCPYRLISVSNGRDAIKYLAGVDEYSDRREFPEPSLVLLDLSLPLMSGFEVLAWMKAEVSRELPPVIVLSYSRLERDRREASQLGVKGYYVKSADLNATMEFVKSLLVLNWLNPGFHRTDSTPPPRTET